MAKYDIIINTILIILILTIIIVVLFGCHYKGCHYFEKFENNDEKKPKEEEKSVLNTFEKTVLEGLSSGSLNTEGLAKLIKEEKFTPTNLDNIIKHVEKFKGNF
jgi:hypothetical protein